MATDDITLKARGVAKCLTYNEDKPQAQAKTLLLELAHRLDAKDICVSNVYKRLVVSNAIGKKRFMTWKERVIWKLFKIKPERV